MSILYNMFMEHQQKIILLYLWELTPLKNKNHTINKVLIARVIDC